MVFGGLGSNPFCPPAIGWAILMVCWPDIVDASSIQLYNEYLDPLYRLKYYGVDDITQFNYVDLLLGRQLGGLGATQVGALLLGGIIVAMRLDVAFETPVGFILGIYILGGAMHYLAPGSYAPATFHLLSGNAVFGAFFLATEFGGSPSRAPSRLLYGMIVGMLTIIIRCFGIYADGVPFAVLLANLCMPYLDLIRPRPFGA
jgi:electron transport complex protein RnfD